MRRAVGAALGCALLLSGCAANSEDNPLAHGQEPLCSEPNETMVLMAQSVQHATRLPCIAEYPAGWAFDGKDVRRDSTTYWLSSSVVGPGTHAIEVRLVPWCDPAGQPFDDPRAVGTESYLATSAAGELRTYRFDGGCVIERIMLPEGTDPELFGEARSTLGFVSREHLAEELEQEFDVVLCGAGASRCEG